METIIHQIQQFIWAYLTIPLLFAVSLFFTFYLGGVQFKFGTMFKSLTAKNGGDDVTPLQSLFMALGAKVGVGSLAGVAIALTVGGPGSIFWMWVSTFITTAASFAESTLSQIFKMRDENRFIGGPAFYIRDGMKSKSAAIAYAIIIILTYTFGFSAVQINTIAASFENSLQIPPLWTGISLTILTSFILMGGAAGITKLVSKIVPVIAIFYIGLGAIAIFTNLHYVGEFFSVIISDAFTGSSIVGGTLMGTLMVGLQRGIFSNEAGLGSGAHAASMTNSENPTEQGYIQAFGVYITTFLVITITAFMLMVTNAPTVMGQGEPIHVTQYAMSTLFGPIGNYLLTLAIFFFGFSTVPTAYFYGESNIRFLTKHKGAVMVLRLLVMAVVFASALTSSGFIWNLVDLGTGATSTINLIALIVLSTQVKNALHFDDTHKKLKKRRI
ncbi:MAG: alanine:cation symporter family protein [Turicibacter sp.]|nr:alanine:cation symporter family protein [Turicibacter sp.]